GPVVAIELVRLAVLLQLRLVLIHLLRRGRLVLVAEESEQGAREVLREVDGRRRLGRRQLLLGLDDAPAPAIDRGIEALQSAGGEKRLAATRAGSEDPDLAAHVGQRAQEGVRAVEIAEHASVGGASRRAHLGPDVLRRAMAVSEVEVRRD